MPNRITKETLIPLGVVISLVFLVFAAGQRIARVEAQADRNTADIQSMTEKLDTLNNNLVQTNNSIIELNATMKALQSQLAKNGQTTNQTFVTNPPDNTTTNITVEDKSPGNSNPPQQSNGIGLLPFLN